jgi:cell division protease FtsH
MFGREYSQGHEYSEKTSQEIDIEIRDIVRKSYDKGVEILKKNIDILHELADLLLKKETVSGDELDKLIYDMRPGIKLPSPKSPDLFHDDNIPDENNNEIDENEKTDKDKDNSKPENTVKSEIV